jgi:hypothetical protein
MTLKDSDIKLVIEFVKKEPRTVQDISKLIKRSWVTTDTYLQQIKERTGLIDIKTFRKGTQAALKIVFYSAAENVPSDEIREHLFHKIRFGRRKEDFDFMEIFQFIDESKKKSFIEEYDVESKSEEQNIASLFQQCTSQLYVFSGNLSFINMTEKNVKIMNMIEDMLKRKVLIKILCRVNVASMSNIQKIQEFMIKYPKLIEIHHSYQPLRGFIIDDKIARFKDEEYLSLYKKGELRKNARIFYEFYDSEWIGWLIKVFWALFRSSLDFNKRLKEIETIFQNI